MNIASWDHAGLTLAYALRAPWLDSLFVAVTWLGSLAVLMPVALVVWWRRGNRNASFVALALIGASALVHIVKLIAARPRPDFFPSLISMPEDASFPSAHAMQVTAFALAWLLRPGAVTRRVETVILLVVVVLVGFSRLYLQVHFPSDVIAGVIFALLWVVFLRRLPVWREQKYET
jgi:membrane-associated phospholipid phosphatase